MLACFNTHISFHVLPVSLMALVILLHDHSSHGSHYLLSPHTKKEEDIEAKDPVCLMTFLFLFRMDNLFRDLLADFLLDLTD